MSGGSKSGGSLSTAGRLPILCQAICTVSGLSREYNARLECSSTDVHSLHTCESARAATDRTVRADSTTGSTASGLSLPGQTRRSSSGIGGESTSLAVTCERTDADGSK